MNIPYSITGPAIVNILQPIPNICPSFLNSIAGDATEFANPVIGTKTPAPAYFAILENIPNPVRTVSYTHLDVYKRQLPSVPRTPKSNAVIRIYTT